MRGSTTEDSQTVQTDANGDFVHNFDPPGGEWPTGDYTCEVYHSGECKQSQEFSVDEMQG